MTGSNRTNHTIPPTSPSKAPDHADSPPDDQQAVDRADIARRIAVAPTRAEQRRWQVIGMVVDGHSIAEIAAATGYRVRTLHEIVRRYRQAGADALADRRSHSKGAPMLLSPQLREELQRALENAPPDGGSWTGPRVARWISNRTGKPIHRQRGWEYLRRLRATPAASRTDEESTFMS